MACSYRSSCFLSPLSTNVRINHHQHNVSHFRNKPLFGRSSRIVITCKSSVSEPSPIRIGIAGAGVAGLSSALAFLHTIKDRDLQITIYDWQTNFPRGAAMIMSGGAAILANQYNLKLSSIGYQWQRIIARSCHQKQCTLYEADLESFVRNGNLGSDKHLIDSDGNIQFYCVLREQLINVLRERVEKHVRLIEGEEGHIIGVSTDADTRTGRFHLANGDTSDEFDLIIGADGLKSCVRTHVASSLLPSGVKAAAKYTGLRVQWAMGLSLNNSLPIGEVNQWFGNGTYCLRAAAGNGPSKHDVVAIVFQEEEKASENALYNEGQEGMRQRFQRRLEISNMPTEVRNVVERATRLIEISIYEHENLPEWSRDGCCILLGDSVGSQFMYSVVHAMAPFLGQGANQAIQDAHSLALAMSRIGTEYEDIPQALTAFQSIRKEQTDKLVSASRVLGFLHTQPAGIRSYMRDALYNLIGSIGGQEFLFVKSAIPLIE